MNKQSLLFYISLFFIFLMIVINTLFFVQYKLEHQQAIEDLIKHFHKSEQILHMSRVDRLPFDEAKKRLYSIMKVELLREEEVVVEDLSIAKVIHNDVHKDILEMPDAIYFILNDRKRGVKLNLRYKGYEGASSQIIIFAILINLFVFLFYLYVVKRLKPLHTLKKRIARFADGDMDVIVDVKGKDEIAEVSREFNHAIEKIQTLQDSRKLFLRNIMHELKTPIAKGKLITDLMDDAKNQERLKRIFFRFEYLLKEFTKIERVTSNAMELNKNQYRVIDILDNALDIMMIEVHDIDIDIKGSPEIEADYDLMSIVLKNLLDNAIKYGKETAKLILYDDKIVVQSTGEKLENISFDTVFNRTYESSDKGLGLGLYITKNIVQKHGFTLLYEYQAEKNNFIIIL